MQVFFSLQLSLNFCQVPNLLSGWNSTLAVWSSPSLPHLLGLCLNCVSQCQNIRKGDICWVSYIHASMIWCWVEPQFLPQSPDGVSLSEGVIFHSYIHGKYPATPIICWGFSISVRLSLMNILFLYFHDILSWEKLCEETQSSECLQTPHNRFYFVALFSSSSWPSQEETRPQLLENLTNLSGFLLITRILGLGFSFFRNPQYQLILSFCISSQTINVRLETVLKRSANNKKA